jgi:hypothetical protein
MAVLASIAAAPAASAQTDELVVSGDGVVPVTVNGVPARIRIDPAVPALPMLTTDYATRARLRAGPFAFG